MNREPTIVLMLEDDEDDYVITRRLLGESEDEDLRLERVGSLEAAVRRLGQGRVDVILSDLGLPDCRGAETYRRLLQVAPSVPIVLLTGLEDEALALAATREGVQDYLVKGRLSGRQLARAIRRAIERHLSEEEIRANAVQLRHIIDEDTDATVVLDDEGHVLFANRATEALFGKPPADLLGTVFGWTVGDGVTERTTFHQAWRGRDAVVEMHAIRTKWGEGQARILRLRDITDRASAETALKLYRENLETMVQRRTEEVRRVNAELGREVAERKKAEARSEDARRYLETIISASHEGIVVLSEGGRFEFYNGAALHIFGWDALTVQGRSFLECVTPDQRATVRRRWSEGRRGEGMVYEADVVRQDGERRSLLVSHREMRLGEAIKYCLGVMDITERKQTERKLEGVLHTVEENYRAKSQFVFNVSHELKTPLASLQFAIGNMLSGIVGSVPERAVAYLEMMREDCERLVRTVNDILDLSRIETKRLVLHRAPVSFARFAAHCVESLRLQSEAKRLTVTQHCQACGFASCDPGKMERVVTNILNNAIKFTPPGGELVVESRRVEAAPVAASRPESGADADSIPAAPPSDGMIEFSVSDNGVGIPREHLPHISERFYRVEEQVSGTGLGLTLCKEMIEAHGGELRIESPPPGREKGTRVSFRIPGLPPPKVLVADDDVIVQNVLAAQLERVGYQAIRCGSGAEALRLIGVELPDAIVIDLLMPGMDGTEAIVRIKADPTWRKVPIVAITGGSISSEKRRVLESFGVPALQKPWQPETLLRTLEEVTYGRAYLRGGV